MGVVDFVLGAFRGSNLLIREWGNGLLYPLMLWLAIVTGIFLVRAVAADPLNWRAERGAQFACVFIWFFIGEGMRALAAWLPLDAARDGRALEARLEDLSSLLFTVGVVVLVIMGVRAIFLFASPGERVRTTLLAGAFVGVLLTIAELLT